MKRIHYASGSLLTGDDIAVAIVRYAAALASRGRAAEVRAPVILETGEEGEVMLLLGPASQMMAEDEEYGGPELHGRAFVTELDTLSAELGPSRAGFVQGGTEELDDLDIDTL